MFLETFKLALNSLKTNRVRAILTMLGIIIGTASVIVIMNLMYSLKTFITNSFASQGTSSLQVTIYDDQFAFSQDELDRIVSENSDIFTDYSPVINASDIEVSNGNTHYQIDVTGVGLDYETINSIDIAEGSFINYIDVNYHKPAAVLGSYTAKALFGDQSPLGQTFKLNGQEFYVTGVLEKGLGYEEEGSPNDIIYIPYTTASKFTDTNRLNNVTIELTDSLNASKGIDILDDFLEEKTGDDSNFRVTSPEEQLDTLNNILNTVTTVLTLITGISLLVGGIGIMNVTFITVVERTKEIGIRTALGAHPRTILLQFIIEAVTTSVLGGIIGIILGIIITILFEYFNDEPIAISLTSILISTGTSIGIGALFGYIPAKRASMMNPITALNAD